MENIALQSLQSLYICITHRKSYYFLLKCGRLSCANTNMYKAQTLQDYIFCYLQHFANTLCNVTSFVMLFSAVVKDFVHIAWIKI